MENILTISGSSKVDSSNAQLLKYISSRFSNMNFNHCDYLHKLPVFYDGIDHSSHESITTWKKDLASADAVIISSPEYIYNMPALLKNALEWVTASGELLKKNILLIVYTPNNPRGQKCLQSLEWSLKALETNIVASMLLHHDDIKFVNKKIVSSNDFEDMIEQAVNLLKN